MAESPADLRFNRDVRPILSDHCFQCHGPDSHQRKAELRLDQEQGVRDAFGEALSKSEAWGRIVSEDPDLRMPPPNSRKELTEAEIAVLRRWIENGAAWEGHWAFQSPSRPTPPDIREAWGTNPIDAFVLNRLKREGIEPSPEAGKERLLRRVTLDLTGLPPTLVEIDAFLSDTRPGAYERAVERLLASKRFGERMAAAWMDLARYGDSSVFHADGPRDMWPWRDWTIRAYNQNKPFNEFTVEQLAGDLLPDSAAEQRIATGFNRNNATTDEGGAIAEEYRVEYAVDRVKTTSMVWLGLTLECAQCHDHKYDPLSQEEYYRFFAFFNQAADPGMQTRNGNQSPITDVPNYRLQRQRQELATLTSGIEQQLAARKTAAEPEFLAWLDKTSREPPKTSAPSDILAHLALDEGSGDVAQDPIRKEVKGKIEGKTAWIEGKHGKAISLSGGASIRLDNIGDFERSDGFSYGAWVKPQGAGGGAVLARMDDGAAFRGFDLLLSGGHVEVHIINAWPNNAIKVRTKDKLPADAWSHLFATYDGSSKAQGITIYLNGKPMPWNIERDGLTATIKTPKPLRIGRRHGSAFYSGLVDDVRLYSRCLTAAEVGALAGFDPIGELLAIPSEQRSEEQQNSLREHYLRQFDVVYGELSQKLAAAASELAEAQKPISTVMVMQNVAQPRMTFVLDRGNYASPRKDQAVEPGVPDIFPALPEGAPANRLGMAQWLVRPDHPLTSRVAVNRYWYMLFGRGLVESVEDFGAQGGWPSHPALLDWLAVEFVDSGWNIKHMIRLMVTSATYRQTSRISSPLAERDPDNILLARGPRFRLQAEFLRDNALAASGLLVDQTGGPSVKPYQPPGLWNAVSLSGNVRFVQDKGEKIYRRGMYTYWKRSAPAPFLTIFDAPSREKCTIRRSRTNTPLQALLILNDPQYVEAARFLAQRVLKMEGGVERQIETAYRLATGVRPSTVTLRLLVQAFHDERAVFTEHSERAAQLLSVGDSPRDESLSVSEHAAMSVICSIILNLDETLTRG